MINMPTAIGCRLAVFGNLQSAVAEVAVPIGLVEYLLDSLG
jgi:hypothetical protein